MFISSLLHDVVDEPPDQSVRQQVLGHQLRGVRSSDAPIPNRVRVHREGRALAATAETRSARDANVPAAFPARFTAARRAVISAMLPRPAQSTLPHTSTCLSIAR